MLPFFIPWSLRSSRLPVKHLSSGSNSRFGICLWTEWEPLPNTSCDYSLCGDDNGIEVLYRALTCVSLQGCACLLPCFPSGLWPPYSKCPWKFFLPLLDLLLVGDEEGASKHLMIRTGWGMLAALKQDLLDHPIHLHHNYMLLLGDYVSLSSLCNCSYAHKQCK